MTITEEIKGIQIGKEEVKRSLFTDDMILDTLPENYQSSLINLSKLSGYKINPQISKE